MEVEIGKEIYQEAYLAIKEAMEAATIKQLEPADPKLLFEKVWITDAYPLPTPEEWKSGTVPDLFKRLALPMSDSRYLRGIIAFTQTFETTAQNSLDDEDGIAVAISYQIDIWSRGGIKKLRNRVLSFFLSAFWAEKNGVKVSWDARNGLTGSVETYLDQYGCSSYFYKLEAEAVKTI